MRILRLLNTTLLPRWHSLCTIRRCVAHLSVYSVPRVYNHFVFFFFQAKDGIRDIGVTGVQTCALPIWRAGAPTPIFSLRQAIIHPPGRFKNRSWRSRPPNLPPAEADVGSGCCGLGVTECTMEIGRGSGRGRV